MTIVVAIESDGAVILGCDSAVQAGDAREAIATPKWWESRGAVVGWAGDLRAASVVEAAHRAMRAPSEDVLAYAQRFAARVRIALRRERIPYNELSLILGLRGRAWSVEGRGTITRSEHGYTAIGSGADYALGSLATTLQTDEPERRVMRALSAASRHSGSCCAPFRVGVYRWRDH